MLNFNTLIQNEYESAYGNAYDLSLKRQFSKPKIYNAKGDLKKRWYVYFSFRDPSTDKLVRQTPFYGNANTYTTKEERMAVLTIYRNIINKYLNAGYSPYEDNTSKRLGEVIPEVHDTSNASDTVSEPTDESNKAVSKTQDDTMTVKEAFQFVMELKERDLEESSLRSLRSHLKIFLEWLEQEQPEIKYISEIDRSIILSFLNKIHLKNSARTRNNYRASLSSVIGTLFENDKVTSNFVEKIKKLPTKPTQHQSYSEDLQKDIFKFLEQKDNFILLYIKFVAYSFLRPIEVCRLKVGDLDLKNKTLRFKAKNDPLKTKIIPDILYRDLPDLSKMDKDALLFTAEGMGKFTKTKLENRRSYFTNRFMKLVKEKFDLDFEHTLYSFRHTFISKLYKGFRKQYSPNESKSRLMHVSGHKTMDALEKYLRDIDAELPPDHSDMLE